METILFALATIRVLCRLAATLVHRLVSKCAVEFIAAFLATALLDVLIGEGAM